MAIVYTHNKPVIVIKSLINLLINVFIPVNIYKIKILALNLNIAINNKEFVLINVNVILNFIIVISKLIIYVLQYYVTIKE